MDLQAGGLLPEALDPIEIGADSWRRYEHLWTDADRRDHVSSTDERYQIDTAHPHASTTWASTSPSSPLTPPTRRVARSSSSRRSSTPATTAAGCCGSPASTCEENQARRLLNDLDSYRAAQYGARASRGDRRPPLGRRRVRARCCAASRRSCAAGWRTRRARPRGARSTVGSPPSARPGRDVGLSRLPRHAYVARAVLAAPPRTTQAVLGSRGCGSLGTVEPPTPASHARPSSVAACGPARVRDSSRARCPAATRR